MDDRPIADEIFSAEQRLHLQQLLTRQSLASQPASTSDDGPEIRNNFDSKHAGSLQDPGESLPKQWRLIAESVKLHQWQSDCLEKWLARGSGTVKVATGGGKTIFALVAAQALQNKKEADLRLAIIVPTIPLMHQWLDELKDTNIPASAIGLMGGGESLGESPNLRILICVINSARDRLPGLVRRLKWSSKLLLVVDECHRANATEARKIFKAFPQYTLGLSATPETDQGDEGIPSNEAYAASEVGQALGPIIFEFSLKESSAAGLLTPFEVWHVGLPLTAEESSEHARMSREISDLRKDLLIAHRRSRSRQGFIPWCQTKASKDGGQDAARFIGMANERKRLIYRAEARTDLALRILSAAMRENDRRAIVFHESIDEINQLFINALEAGIPAVLEHSKLPTSLRAGNIGAFRQGIARTIVSAKSLVEGFNVPSADLGIIAASSGSVRQRIQSLGRMLRKKSTGRTAVIFVLYVRDTEDEAIYQKADWETVIGAEKNRYFEWTPPAIDEVRDLQPELSDLLNEFREVGIPPRQYRPPCQEIEPKTLEIDSPYPAQATGVEMKVDHAGNLRLEDGTLAQVSKEIIDKILQLNRYKRAVRTPCGHLIVRTDAGQQRDETWIYLGNILLPEPEQSAEAIKLILRSVSGRRVIAKKTGRNEVFARGPDKAESRQAGEAQTALLDWVRQQEDREQQTVRELYWDGSSGYWLELGGTRILFSGEAAPLEFPA